MRCYASPLLLFLLLLLLLGQLTLLSSRGRLEEEKKGSPGKTFENKTYKEEEEEEEEERERLSAQKEKQKQKQKQKQTQAEEDDKNALPEIPACTLKAAQKRGVFVGLMMP